MDIVVKTVVKYTYVLECACYAVRGSVYDETFPLDTVYVTCHNKTGQLSVTKKNVIFLSSERAFY